MLQKPRQYSLHHFPAVKVLVGCSLGIALFSMFSFVPISFVPTAVIGSATLLCSLTGIIIAAIIHRQRLPNSDLTVYLRIAASGVYWCATVAIGWMICWEAQSSRVVQNVQTITPAMPAVVRGEILRVLRHDSVLTRVLVRGEIDTKAFPRLHETTTLLTVFTGKYNDTNRSAIQKSIADKVYLHRDSIRSGMSIYAVVSASLPRRALLPTDFDEENYAASLGASFLARAEVRNVAVVQEYLTLQRLTDMARAALERRINTLFPAATAPFALALLTGNTEHLAFETKREYARAGTVHVLAVSGLHISLIMAIILVPLAFVRHVAVRWVLSVMGITIFVLLTGAAPSAMRSAVMAALFLLAFAVERRASLLNTVAISVLLLLAWQPRLLYSPGFQMSAAAVFGISLALPVFEEGFLRLMGVRAVSRRRDFPIRSVLASALGITFAASLAVAPIVAWYFGVVSLISPLANLAIVPLSSIAMLYTLASVVFSGFWAYGAELFAQTAHTCLLGMNALNHHAAQPHFAAVEGRYALGLALSLSAAMLYCAWSASWRVFAFRGVVVIAAGVLLMMILDVHTPSPQVRLLPREQIVAAVVPMHGHCVVLLQDRRAWSFGDERPKPDISLEHYVQEYCLAEQDSLTLCTTGAASMLIASRISELVAKRQAQEKPHVPVRMRVVAQSLLYKDPLFFAALDTLQARGVNVSSASDVIKRDTVLRLIENIGEAPEKKRFVAWDGIHGTLMVSRTQQTDTILLPKAMENWAW